MASVKMPQLGESITEGTISKWLKQPGDQGKKYEGLVETLTDTELARIEGSGIGGRISKKDIDDYVAKRTQPAAANGEQQQQAPPTTAPAPSPGTTVPLSPMRRAIASNMLKSKQTIPHAWTVAEVDMTNVVRFRQKAKDGFKQREGIDLTYVPIIVKAVVEGLKAVPILNASWSDQGVVLHKDINVGVAVSVDDGLIVPVIHQADRMSIAGLAKAADDLAQRARAGKLGIPDVQGATFTVNNPGTFGTILSYSIIAPPQAGILAMDAIVKRPVVIEADAIAVRSMMNLCLSFDHRVLDGVSAARFLQGVRRWLEGFSEQVPLY